MKLSKDIAKGPVVLCILDGWGYRTESTHNAISLADTPVWDNLYAENPTCFLKTSGLDVGLPMGQVGNSEVGHMNLGAGRIVMQQLPKIDSDIQNGFIKESNTIKNIISTLKKTRGTCHIMGLLSEGGVHSHQSHMASISKIIANTGITVKIHAFLDGRDTGPKSALYFIKKFNDLTVKTNIKIVTIAGRYYAMDRDNRWERIHKAYNTIVKGKDTLNKDYFLDPIDVINNAYQNGITDEFILPTVIGNYNGISNGDALFVTNFRADRVRQLLSALCIPNFTKFNRQYYPLFSIKAGMIEYSNILSKYMCSIYPPKRLKNVIGEVIQNSSLKQLRIAETEKYAHVSFFFNGGKEAVFEGEDRILVPSPKVSTYDLKPDMSAEEVVNQLITAIYTKNYDFIVVNFANPDMVGHTGILEAAQKAVESVDKCLGKLVHTIKLMNGIIFITADHGNCELMHDIKNNQPHTAHTLNMVPSILVNANNKITLKKQGILADVSPTLLELLGLIQPQEMTGHSLIDYNK